MYYNFYVFLIILATISPFAAYNRTTILSKIDIQDEVTIMSVSLLVIYLLIKIVSKKDMIPKIDNSTMMYLIVNSILASISLYLGGMILIKENTFKFKSLQKGVYLIILVMVSCCIYEQKFNYKIFIGIILLIIGSYLIDQNI